MRNYEIILQINNLNWSEKWRNVWVRGEGNRLRSLLGKVCLTALGKINGLEDDDCTIETVVEEDM